MEIRWITRQDVEQIYAIELEAFTSPWSRQAILTEVISEKSYYLVAVVDDEVIGYAGLWKIFDEGHITNIAVKWGYRNKGIGKTLMQKLIAESMEVGIHRFTLEVRVSNERAIHLYESLGFNTAGVRKNFYDKPNEDALIMWKEYPAENEINEDN